METRTIAIANTKTQRRYTIESNATTLGELMDQMTEQGIDFDGMTFTEGISKTQLISRDSLLPTNVMYKGTPTNNLVMLLTNPNKQIASGTIDRKEAFRLIKELNLQKAVNEGEGVNWTRAKTDVLETYIKVAQHGEEAPKERHEKKEDTTGNRKAVGSLPNVTAVHTGTVNWLFDGIKAMVSENTLCVEDVIALADLTTELSHRLWETRVTISDSDIDDIIDGIL